jgi:hypothetical protein
MKRAIFHSIMVLVLVLGLTLSMAAPALAQGISGSKVLDPDFEQDEYYVGDTIYYVMNVTNPGSDPITLENIWDELPDGSVHYFVEDGEPEPLVLGPGAYAIYTISYTIRAVDVEYIDPPGFDPYYGVRNLFFAQGADGLPSLAVDELTEVLQHPPVGGTAHPVSRLALLAPWIVLAGIMAGVAVFVWSRRAQARA